MDCRLKAVILLTLCALAAKTEPSYPLIKTRPLASENIQNIKPCSEIITLNITISIPQPGNNNTEFTSTQWDDMSQTHLLFSIQAEKFGTNAPCKNSSTVSSGSSGTKSSCNSPEEPELVVQVVKETESENILVCSANVSNEELWLTVNTKGREIDVSHNVTHRPINTATVYLNLVTSRICSLAFTKTSSAMSIIAKVVQTMIPTTTTTTSTSPTPTTSTSPTPTTTTATTTISTSASSTSSKTTVFSTRKETSKKPAPAPPVTKSTGEPSLCRGPLSGIILLVLLPLLLLN